MTSLLTPGRAAALLGLLTVATLCAFLPFRAPLARIWADEGTYLAMTRSLVEDGDLAFEPEDLERLEGAEDGGGTVILQRSTAGITYSKPILLPLAAAPLYALLGEGGVILTNVLALGVGLLLAYAYLLRIGSAGRAALTLVTFAGASVLLPYLTWRMSDVLQASLALAGLALCFARARTAGPPPPGLFQGLLSKPWAPYLGALLLGFLVTMRVSNALLALTPVAAALFLRQFRRALLLALATLGPFLLILGVTRAATGTADPYRAVRTSFDQRTGYPAGPGAEAALRRFAEVPATHHTGWRPRPGLRRVAYSTLYFFVGRHTGLVVYFPAALVLLFAAARRPDSSAAALLLGFGGTVAFFLGWLPWNYFGGETFLGNRYLLVLYPALLMALRRLPHPAALALAWGLAAVAYSSALTSAVRYHDLDRSSQNHTYAGIFRLLPYESTAQSLSGRRDHYWSGHLVRFVDPFATARRWSFWLDTGMPAPEIMTAEWRPLEAIRLLVTADLPEATLHFEDHGRAESFTLGTGRGERSRRIDIQVSEPWRRHRFWWNEEVVYDVRTFRLRLTTPDCDPGRVRIRYLGDPALGADSASYQLLGQRILGAPVAGALSTVELRLRNTSERIWEAEDVAPVASTYAFFRGSSREPVAAGELQPLPHRVAPGREVAARLELRWPEQPGTYRLEVDLALGREGSFATWIGRPAVRRTLQVRRAP